MAIHHALSGELIDIRPLKDNLKTTATKALFKSNHVEVSRIVLLTGEDVPAAFGIVATFATGSKFAPKRR